MLYVALTQNSKPLTQNPKNTVERSEIPHTYGEGAGQTHHNFNLIENG
jgi:hypothetical protein